MVVLCNELLSSSNKSEDDKEDDIPTAFRHLSFAASHADSNHRIPTEMLGEVIKCFRDAVKVYLPASYKVMYALAQMLFI